jgi:preprotein translocase subunit YajC
MQPESLILLVLLGGFLLLTVNRTRRQQREAANLQAQVSEGARVMTTAGLYATVVGMDDSTVTLETAPGQQSRWDRRAIARILADEPPAVTVADSTERIGQEEGAPATESTPERAPDGTAGTGVSAPETAPPDRV